jgi:hypothetical protein
LLFVIAVTLVNNNFYTKIHFRELLIWLCRYHLFIALSIKYNKSVDARILEIHIVFQSLQLLSINDAIDFFDATIIYYHMKPSQVAVGNTYIF